MYKKRYFWAFILPSLAAFIFVVGIPLIQGIYASFTNWQSLMDKNGDHINGFNNYKVAIQDKLYVKSFIYTIKYSLVAIILVNVLGFSLATLLTKSFKGRNFFRAGLFLPNLIGGLVLGYAWQILFTRGFQSLGIEQWLTTPRNTFWSLELVTAWQYAGYMMIIYVAAIQNIPDDQIEAANVAGASRFKIFRTIKVPNLMPAFTVAIFLTLSKSFKIYALSVSLTNGGTHDSSVVAVNIFSTAFQTGELQLTNHLGVAQAKAVYFTIFVSVLAITQVSWTKRRELEA